MKSNKSFAVPLLTTGTKLKFPYGRLVRVTILSCLGLASTLASAQDGRQLFSSSAVENTIDNTVSLPLYRGSSQGKSVWYVVLDSSTDNEESRYFCESLFWASQPKQAAKT